MFGYFGSVSITSGLVFVPGNGDGTFGTPVPFSQTNSSTPGEPLFAADLSNDGKLDLIWNGSVYLGNGDGTFRQIPLGIACPTLPQAVGDLNGDGKLDIVAGSKVYAGNGDGSFQTTPLFTYSGGNLPVFIGDVNGDGNPDLLTGLPPVYPKNELGNYQLTVFLGTGNGNFVQDSNAYIYPTGFPGIPGVAAGGAIARLNSKAPAPPNDKTLDFIAPTYFGATSLLNRLNPAPGAAQPVPSRTQLAASATNLVTNQDLTLTVTVTGIAPTGNVTFRSPGGEGVAALVFEVPITNGIASITTGRPAGTYSFTASYSGDTNNNASTSNTVTVTVTPAPTTTALSASSSNVNQGQLITYTATVTARYPPHGNRNLYLGHHYTRQERPHLQFSAIPFGRCGIASSLRHHSRNLQRDGQLLRRRQQPAQHLERGVDHRRRVRLHSDLQLWLGDRKGRTDGELLHQHDLCRRL